MLLLSTFIMNLKLLVLPLLLSACATVEVPIDANTDTQARLSSSSESQALESSFSVKQREMDYTGTIQSVGISIYQQGTHRLALEDDTFLLLQSDTVDLNGYVGEFVTVNGIVEGTVEADGKIMTVSSIELEDSSSSEDSSESSDTSGSDDNLDTTDEDSTESSSSDVEVDDEVNIETNSMNPEASALAEAMASADTSTANWTVQYCSPLEPFCIPIHKNWWYKSFGATGSDLLRVDIAAQEVENVDDGIIVVRLKSQTLADINKQDKQIVVSNGMVVGYRTWDDGRHFEITAPAILRDSVEYITINLSQENDF